MRVFLIIAGICAAASAAPLGACELELIKFVKNVPWIVNFVSIAGPVKISDNNIENIFNININIQGVFSNNVEQDIVNVVVGLLNQQGVAVGGATLKDQIMALAQKTNSNEMNLDVPVGSAGKSFNFDGLASKIQEAIASKSSESAAPSQDKLTT